MAVVHQFNLSPQRSPRETRAGGCAEVSPKDVTGVAGQICICNQRNSLLENHPHGVLVIAWPWPWIQPMVVESPPHGCTSVGRTNRASVVTLTSTKSCSSAKAVLLLNSPDPSLPVLLGAMTYPQGFNKGGGFRTVQEARLSISAVPWITPF